MAARRLGNLKRIVGIIAEGESDVEVIQILLRKMASKSFSVSPMVGHGCGKIRSHCARWAALLKSRGCNRLIVVHDSDKEDPQKLANLLTTKLGSNAITPRTVVVPVREIEAWLLADEEAISSVLSLEPELKDIGNTEKLDDPKAHLRQLVRARAKKLRDYLPATHNVKVAQEVRISKLKKCNSFAPLAAFATKHL